ncbi:reverse transcriptase domain-containing protein [Tanacetum coccineum]
MPPRMTTRRAGQPVAASRGGGTGGRAGKGGGRTGAQVGDQGRGQGNGRNQNGDAINDNIQGDVRNVIENNNHRGLGFEKKESVQDMSGYRDNQKIHTRGREAAVGMSWEDLITLTREEFCPSNEMQKLETELWNHAMVGASHAAYTNRFHELARLVPHLVTPENKRIERRKHQNQVVAVNKGQGRGNNDNQACGRAFMLGAEEAR